MSTTTSTGDPHPSTAAPAPPSIVNLLPLIAIGGLVALSLGVYARVHTPTGQGITTFGFPAVLPMKAWFTTVAAALGLTQAASALWMYGRLPGVAAPAPGWLGPTHRWLGTAAFLFTLPVAYHCLWALGFQNTTLRVLAHSILGCAFYGAFVTKMLVLRSDRLPGWSLPVTGGALFALLTGLWFTSSLWFFTTIGFPGV
ncbi:MAG: DUF6529 family protein [Actinomycetota bacterium]